MEKIWRCTTCILHRRNHREEIINLIFILHPAIVSRLIFLLVCVDGWEEILLVYLANMGSKPLATLSTQVNPADLLEIVERHVR